MLVLGQPGLKSSDTRRWQKNPHLRTSIEYLHGVFAYLQKHEIKMYRMSSDIAPYATHPDMPQFHGQVTESAAELRALGQSAKDAGLRLSFHPSQYTILNSPNPELNRKSVWDIESQATILDTMDAGPEGVIIVHVGGVYGEKPAAMDRWVASYKALPEAAKRRLVLENDDISYSAAEVLQLHERTGVPCVFDSHHFNCNNPEGLDLGETAAKFLATWPTGVRPKVHVSSPRTEMRELKRRNRKTKKLETVALPPVWTGHSDYDDPFAFIDLMKKYPRRRGVRHHARIQEQGPRPAPSAGRSPTLRARRGAALRPDARQPGALGDGGNHPERAAAGEGSRPRAAVKSRLKLLRAYGLLACVSMAKTWHYTVDGVDAQVLDEKTFVEHCRDGKVTDAAMVWTAGMEAWRPYSELRAAEEANAEAAARRVAQKKAEDEAALKTEREVCDKCRKDWPIPLMVQLKTRWLCRACHHREKEEARLLAERKAGLKSNHWAEHKFLICFVAGFALLGAIGYFTVRILTDVLNAPPRQAPEKWADLPPEQWPQIALPGEVLIQGTTQPVPAANGFLIENGIHVLGSGFASVLQTAAHPEAVPTDLLVRRLNVSLTGWTLGSPAAHVTFTKVHGQPVAYARTGVLFLDATPPLITAMTTLPATALKTRTGSFDKGMRIFVVGTTPERAGEKQAIYSGKLHGTLNAKRTLDLEMDKPINPAALLGAPVLDDGGHFAGVVDGTFDSPDKNGEINTLSAESLNDFVGPLGLDTAAPAPTAGGTKTAANGGDHHSGNVPGKTAPPVKTSNKNAADSNNAK